MALALETLCNVGSGTLGAFPKIFGTPLPKTTPAPPYRYAAYVLDCNSGGAIADGVMTPAFPKAANKYAVGFYVRFTQVDGTNFNFGGVSDGGTKYHLRLRTTIDGKLIVLDAGGHGVGTTSVGVFRNDAWHRVELLFTHGDPGDVIVHVDGVEALNLTGQDFDTGTGTKLAFYMGGQGSGAAEPTDTFFGDACYVYSGASSVDDFVGPFGCLNYRHDENSDVPDVGDALDNGTTWADAAEVPFSDADYAEYITANDKGVVTTDYGGGSLIPGPYGDERIGANDQILGAAWLVRRSTATFTFHYGKTPYDEPHVDNTTGVNLGSVGAPTSHLIVSEDSGDVPTLNDYFQYGFKATTPGGFPPTWRMYGCDCALFLKVGARGITLGSGYASRDKDVLVG